MNKKRLFVERLKLSEEVQPLKIGSGKIVGVVEDGFADGLILWFEGVGLHYDVSPVTNFRIFSVGDILPDDYEHVALVLLHGGTYRHLYKQVKP